MESAAYLPMNHNDDCADYDEDYLQPFWQKNDLNLPIIPRREMISCSNPSKTKLITVKRFRSESDAMGHKDVRLAPKEILIDESFS